MSTKKTKTDLTPPVKREIFDRPIYDGKELRRNLGIADERFRAYELPSLQSGRLVYPREQS